MVIEIFLQNNGLTLQVFFKEKRSKKNRGIVG